MLKIGFKSNSPPGALSIQGGFWLNQRKTISNENIHTSEATDGT